LAEITIARHARRESQLKKPFSLNENGFLIVAETG
jgi:hypothetical protein